MTTLKHVVESNETKQTNKQTKIPKKSPASKATPTKNRSETAKKKKGATPPLTKGSPAPKLRDIFEGAGFQHVPADGLHFNVSGRTGELDHIFVWENVILLCEETTATKDVPKHCVNKIYLHQKIAEQWSTDFFAKYSLQNKHLPAAISKKYQDQDLEVRHIYYSENVDVMDSIGDPSPMRIISRAQARYFASLVETISRSAKFELLKFLGVALHQVGDARISGSGVASNSFQAFALPAAHTSYPLGFTVVSFYADPMALIQRAYVMRRDGWEDPDLSYQRFVKAEKLVAMREYLGDNGKVFINNLIVTLPPTTLLTDQNSKPIDPNALQQKLSVQLNLPLELGTVGIVDGQHRILSYYEGSDPMDSKISNLRQRQNLLVTGIIFPANYTPEMRVKFEAEIFLGINNNQSAVHTQLRQDLETIINPETPLAIARTVVTRLSKEGALAGMMQMSQFDPADKISSGSLGPYVVKPLVRKNSALYKKWDSTGARNLNETKDRKEYIEFCVLEIKRLLAGASGHMKEKWNSVPNGGVLSTTVVGGLFLLLDRLVKEGSTPSSIDYDSKLKNIASFDFAPYTGSSWSKLSTALLAAL